MDVQNATGALDSEVELNPFGFVPSYASRILGLGGAGASVEPAYAFHTPYTYCAAGIVTFRIKFSNLRASIGNLTIRVNGTSPSANSIARTVKLTAVPLRNIAFLDGEVTVSFKAKSGILYAVVGLVHGDCDAAADNLHIFLDRPGDSSVLLDEEGESRFTVFGLGATRPVAQLVTSARATLADPVSQLCTNAQFNEPVFERWLSAADLPRRNSHFQWGFVYILQALERYGVLQPGAKGVGFGVHADSPIPALLAGLGCEVLVTAPIEHIEVFDADKDECRRRAFRRESICSNGVFDQAVRFRSVDVAQVPEDVSGFDFCWSQSLLENFGSRERGLEFIANSMACIKMGGISVHTTSRYLPSGIDVPDDASDVVFRKKDIERLALDLVSHGHEVAQISYANDSGLDVAYIEHSSSVYGKSSSERGRYNVTSFGLISRRGDLPL